MIDCITNQKSLYLPDFGDFIQFKNIKIVKTKVKEDILTP